MGLFDKLFNKEEKIELPELNVADDAIVAIADGELIDITTVKDAVFSQKLMGDGVAFIFPNEKVVLCSPANGKLEALMTALI